MGKAHQHAHPCGPEPVMPAVQLPRVPQARGEKEGAQVDAQIKDTEGPVPPVITRRVEAAHLG